MLTHHHQRRRSTTSSPSSSKKLSKLQMKGIFTLTIFLITADSFAHSAAATTTTTQRNHKTTSAAECPASATTTTTPESSSDGSSYGSINSKPGSTRLLPNQFRNRIKNPHWKYCESKACQTCFQSCSSSSSSSSSDSISSGSGATATAAFPRGGHLSPASSTTAAAAADSMAEAASVLVPPPYGIPLNVWKVLLQAFLTCLNIVCWYVPLKSKRMAQNQLLLSLANAFSGGVFLSLAFCHLIPECAHAFPSHWSEAAPFALVLVGYLIIFFVEKIAFDAHDILHQMQAGGGTHDHQHHHSHTTTTPAPSSPPIPNGTSHLGGSKSSPDAAPVSSTSSSMEAAATAPSSGRSAMILLAALGVHSVLEMMALGLSDSFSDAALLTASIALHQPAESIALLVAFVKSGLSEMQIVYFLSIFSCMGPIGVALGMAVNEYAAPIVDSIMLAIVAGTFVYVGATEVIPEEWETSEHKWKKFAALMTGIGMIVAITQYTESLGH